MQAVSIKCQGAILTQSTINPTIVAVKMPDGTDRRVLSGGTPLNFKTAELFLRAIARDERGLDIRRFREVAQVW